MKTFTDKSNFFDFIMSFDGELKICKNEVFHENKLIAKLITK